jgi:hypothetical protein
MLSSASKIISSGTQQLMLAMILSALLVRTRKVGRYIDFLMSVGREMRGGNGFIYLKVLQL